MEEKYLKTYKKLIKKLKNKKIKFETKELFNGFKVSFPEYKDPKKGIPDVVLHEYSYGEELGLLESMGFEEDEGDVTGYLTVEDVIKRLERIREAKQKAQKDRDVFVSQFILH